MFIQKNTVASKEKQRFLNKIFVFFDLHRKYKRYEAFGRAYSYSLQSQTMSSFPIVQLNRQAERYTSLEIK